MLRRILAVTAFCALPGSAAAALTSVDSTSIVRFEQRDIPGADRQEMAPLTEFLGLDVDRLGDGNLSLHFYGWGRVDLADKSFNDNKAGGSLTYGYLQYHFREANANVKLGRFFVHEGVVNEQLDGAGARTDLPGGFSLAAFGGAPVHTAHIFGEDSDGKGKSIFGGRLSYRYGGMLDLGLSGVYEGASPTLVSHLSGNHRLLGGDLWLSPHKMVELTGHTSYNTETSRIAEHSYLLSVHPLPELTLSGEFNEQQDRSYFYSWAMFSRAALDPSDKSRSGGGLVSYRVAKGAEVSADYRHYSRTAGGADRFGAEGKVALAKNTVRLGAGYHYLRADAAFAISGTPSASYHEVRGWGMYDAARLFGALDVVSYLFKDKILNEGSAWETVASVGYHITPALAVSGDVSYGRNPEFTEEVRGLLRLTYNMTYGGKGGSK